MNQIIRTLLTCTLALITLSPLAAQEEQQQPIDTTLTLTERYTEMLRRSENWKEFEMVRRSTLNVFWAALSDSVNAANVELKEALGEKLSLEAELKKASASLAAANTALEAKSADSGNPRLLGIRMSSGAMNAVFIVVVLILGGLSIYYAQRFRNGNSTVKETVKEHETLEKSYDELRHKSKETQMKLKRELQTALNRLEAVGR